MKKHWTLLDPDPEVIEDLTRELNCHPITAAVMANRGIVTPTDARDFFTISFNKMRSAFTLKDMDAAVCRIHKAIIDKEKILIFGDYDVDGITATVILLKFLLSTGANVSYYIPHRVKEGYSIQPQHISHYAVPNNIDLIITADCGSSSHQAAAAAKKFGIDMVITDHHNISQAIPSALAIINPKRRDCHADLQNLAGVGVVFFLLICLRAYMRDKGFWNEHREPNLKNYCDLVALGTLADIVPLIEENRILCKVGLDLINANQSPGISALLKVSAIQKEYLDAEDVAFRLAPRLNAAGRMDHAARAVELLMAESNDIAMKSAQTLNLLNQRRQDLERRTFADIQSYVEINSSLLRQRSLVLAREGWHAGILGIVASRLVDTYHRPVVLISTEDGIGKGSGRSIAGLNIYDALTACKSCLENYGGHSMAAGLKIREEYITDFQDTFESVIQRISKPEDLIPTIDIDAELEFSSISDALVDELETLMPFGPRNPEPIFIASKVAAVSSKIVGKKHRRMALRQSSAANSPTLQAIQFNVDDQSIQKKNFEKIVFKLRWNRWKTRKSAQIYIEDLA
jgi:single-stranded-DNA-specific exonuclease